MALIARGTEEILKREELEKRLATGKPLRIKVDSIRLRRIYIWAIPFC